MKIEWIRIRKSKTEEAWGYFIRESANTNKNKGAYFTKGSKNAIFLSTEINWMSFIFDLHLQAKQKREKRVWRLEKWKAQKGLLFE